MKVNDKYDVCHIVIENNPNPSKFTEAFKNTALSHIAIIVELTSNKKPLVT